MYLVLTWLIVRGFAWLEARLNTHRRAVSAAAPGRPAPRVLNEQLVRYAGYRRPDGSVAGDPRYVAFTALAHELGCGRRRRKVRRAAAVSTRHGRQAAAGEPAGDAVLEVPIAHPEYGWFAELGLRWHAVPAIANMRLSIGGVDYPLAPFSGWYMGTEIGARNLADAQRYNQIPVIAARMGLDTSSESTLWRDRALVELNRAVLWSYERAGVRVTDHHSESRLFLTHMERERRAGRDTPADWTWIVPPLSGGLTPVFHRYYTEADMTGPLDSDGRLRGRMWRPMTTAARSSTASTPGSRCSTAPSASTSPPIPR